jgi:hypothetical protein
MTRMLLSEDCIRCRQKAKLITLFVEERKIS